LLQLSWQSFGIKVVASSFGLLAMLSRQHLAKSALQKNTLNDLDLICSQFEKDMVKNRGKFANNVF